MAKLEIKEYSPIYFDALRRLHSTRNSPTTSFLSSETLPKIGFVVSNETEYVAFGFLRRLEGGYAQLDTFVTNPDSSSENRNEALNLLAARLIQEAKALELRGVYVLTSDETVYKRAVATGFQLLPQVIVGMTLE